MSPEQEQQVADALAEGLSQREAARRVGVSPTAVARVAARQPATQATEPEETTLTADHEDQAGPQLAELEAALAGKRQELAEALEVHQERARASESAIATLEQERLDGLRDGRDVVPLRTRRADAEANLADSRTVAAMIAGQLAEVGVQLAAIVDRRGLAQLRAELDAAVAERDAVASQTGPRQRACVEAVRAAAEGFVLALSDEREATGRVDELAAAVAAGAAALGEPGPVVPAAAGTGLWVSPDQAVTGGPLALLRALNEARTGNAQAVAIRLGEAYGWTPAPPPTAEEIAEWQARQAEMALHRGPHQGQPWTRPDTSSVDVDAQGNELRQRPPRQPHPSDAYLPHAAAVTTGWLGGQPWPG